MTPSNRIKDTEVVDPTALATDLRPNLENPNRGPRLGLAAVAVTFAVALLAGSAAAGHGGLFGTSDTDGWVDAHGDTMYGPLVMEDDVDVGSDKVVFETGALQPGVGSGLFFDGERVCVANRDISGCGGGGGGQTDSVAWENVTEKPAGFADDVDNDTKYVNGSGLELDSSTSPSTFRLPTTCSNGEVLKQRDVDGDRDAEGWACEADDFEADTTAGAGAGLSLDRDGDHNVNAGPGLAIGFDEVTVSAGDGVTIAGGAVALDQSCATDEILKWNGTSWTCSADEGTGTSTVDWDNVTSKPSGFDDDVDNDTTYDGTDFALSDQACGAGDVVTGVDASGNVVCEAPSSADAWLLGGNGGTDPSTDFLGTTDRTNLTVKVDGTNALRYVPTDGTPNIVGGNASNVVLSGVEGAVVAGGGTGVDPHTASAHHAAVGGGLGNTASGQGATVAGGEDNTASWDQATVGGGIHNMASDGQATVAGGQSNTASGQGATVAGGSANTASGFVAAVGGGSVNTADGERATVPGGISNVAAGQYSFAAGAGANASHDGSFVWSDSTGFLQDAFGSTGPDQFLVNASGGVGIDTDSPASALDVDGTVTASDADLGADAIDAAEVDSTSVQERVAEACSGDAAIESIARNGSVSCVTVSTDAWLLGGNSGTNASKNFLGTTDLNDLVLKVDGNESLRLDVAPNASNLVGGAAGNSMRDGVEGAVVAGGGTPDLEVERVTCVVTCSTTYESFGDQWNNVTDDFGTVSGGAGNQAGDDDGRTDFDARFATVGGGVFNVADAEESTVGGGRSNYASGIQATVAGGSANTGSGGAAAVGGGEFNTASGLDSTVAGGDSNTASGISSTIPGGESNIAGGDYSFAAGAGANASHDGSFVWSDSSDRTTDSFNSTAQDQFLVNASGGVGIGTNSPTESLDVAGNISVRGGGIQTDGVEDLHLLGADDQDFDDVILGDGATTTPDIDVEMAAGGLCVDDDGSCTPPLDGEVNALAFNTGSSDLAEVYPSDDALQPAEVVTVDEDVPGQFQRTTEPAQEGPLRVVSTDPGLLLGAPTGEELAEAGIGGEEAPTFGDTHVLPGTYPIALSGRVPVEATAEAGPIEVGDRLTSSSVPGTAMKATGDDPVLGVALEPLEAGTGTITAFVAPQGGAVSGADGAAAAEPLSGLQETVDTQAETIDNLEEENAKLEQQVEDLERENAHLRENVTALQEKLDRLTQAVEQLQRDGVDSGTRRAR